MPSPRRVGIFRQSFSFLAFLSSFFFPRVGGALLLLLRSALPLAPRGVGEAPSKMLTEQRRESPPFVSFEKHSLEKEVFQILDTLFSFRLSLFFLSFSFLFSLFFFFFPRIPTNQKHTRLS
jgi:hypothetical protein